MVKKVISHESLTSELLSEVDSIFRSEAQDIVNYLEKKGYIEVEEIKFNIIVPHAFENQKFNEDIFSKELGFIEYSKTKKNQKDYQFTQEEIDNNPVLKKLEAFKVEVK